MRTVVVTVVVRPVAWVTSPPPAPVTVRVTVTVVSPAVVGGVEDGVVGEGELLGVVGVGVGVVPAPPPVPDGFWRTATWPAWAAPSSPRASDNEMRISPSAR